MQLVLCARWLNQPDEVPIALYKTKTGKVIYLTGNKIAKLLQKAAKSYARHYSGRTQAVFRSFIAGLGLRVA
jgi:hypothetical protein